MKCLQRAFIEGLNNPRGNQKTAILHGWLNNKIKERLNNVYQVISQTEEGDHSEGALQGTYYEKQVDLQVKRNNVNLGVISVKFPISNYQKNSNNYFEGLLGETANLRSNDIVFAHLMCLTDPIISMNKQGGIKKLERFKPKDLQKYSRLADDFDDKHVPHAIGLPIMKLNINYDDNPADIKFSDLKIVSFADPVSMDFGNEEAKMLKQRFGIENFINAFVQHIELRYWTGWPQ